MLNKNLKSAGAGILALSLLLVSVSGQARLPQNEFACQVNTAGGKLGLVLVQADDKQLARSVAERAIAWEIGGTQSETLAVIECIAVPGEQFKDSWFQKFYTDFEM